MQVLDCQGSCDNSQLVSCSMDKSVVLWDVTSGNFSRKWRGHQVYTSFPHLSVTALPGIKQVDTWVILFIFFPPG